MKGNTGSNTLHSPLLSTLAFISSPKLLIAIQVNFLSRFPFVALHKSLNSPDSFYGHNCRQSPERVYKWGEGGNSHLTSRFCTDQLGLNPHSKMVLEPILDPATYHTIHSLVRKSHIAYLSSQGATYILVGQLHLMPIGFKLKSNMVSKPIVHLSSCLFQQAHLYWQAFVEGRCQEVPHRLPQFLGCSLYICWTTSLSAN